MSRRLKFAQLALAGALAGASPVLAQSSGHGSHGQAAPKAQPAQGGHGSAHGANHGANHGATHAGDASPSSVAFAVANAKMHEGMNIRFTGDADVDFARGMIAHHQGAVDMAKILLTHGKDPEMRKLAEEVVRTQEAEIAFMKDWLAKKGK